MASMISITYIQYFFKILFTIILMTAIVFLVSAYIKVDIDTIESEANIFYNRIIFAKGGISYYDSDLDKVYPGLIDINHFTDPDLPDKLESLISFTEKDKRRMAARIALYDAQGLVHEVFHNEKHYTYLLPLSYQGTGPGASTRVDHVLYARIMDSKKIEDRKKETDSKILPGKLVITVLIPNS